MDAKESPSSQCEDVENAAKVEVADNSSITPATLTPAELSRVEKKVLRKQDSVIVPLLAGCTFFVFLVRRLNTSATCTAP